MERNTVVVVMSKAMERLTRLREMVEGAKKTGCVEANLIRHCFRLREDVLQAAQDLSSAESDSSLSQISSDYREIAELLDRLLGELMNDDFAELEELLCDLNSRMLLIESRLG